MITKDMIPELKKRVGKSWDNPIFQHYLEAETREKHTCPICGAVLWEYRPLYIHIHKKHPDSFENGAIIKALDPLDKVKEILEDKKDPKVIGLGEFFAEIVTSPHNKHVLLNMIGKTGMGKSYSSMYISEQVAKAIANIKGGDAFQYFNINNVAIMKLDSIIPIIEDLDQRRFNIIILDDIGASYSAREFNSAVNKNINKVFQVFRDTNTMLILTMPDTFLIDKVARKLAHFQIEIVEARHSQGITIGKLFEVVDMYRQNGKVHYHFPQRNGVKYTKVIFKKPSKEIVQAYDLKRAEIRKVIMADSMEAVRQADANVKGKEPEGQKVPLFVQAAEKIKDLLLSDPKLSERKLQDMVGVGRDTVRKAKQHLISSGQLKI